MAATTPTLGGTAMPQVSLYTEEPKYYGGNVITAAGSVRWQLVSTTLYRTYTLEWVALTEAEVGTVEAAWATVDNGTAAFVIPRTGGTITVDRDPDATLNWTWFTDASGNFRADGRMILRGSP